ncbi:MAG: hypothetical protein JSU88_10845, partial [Nitrospinaceae bacterium]
ANHLQTSNVCDDCHITSNWTTVNFDHTGITASCTTCHNGTTATGKPATHVQTSASCDACHSTISWVPANFDHSSVNGSCSSCHNGTTATGKPANHFATTLQCDECHTINNWTSVDFNHSSPSYPGDHSSSVTCLHCHQGNTQTVTWIFGAYKPDCAGCHADDFEPNNHKKYENPDTFYSVSELRDCSGACHLYEDSSMTTIKKSQRGEHQPRDSSF